MGARERLIRALDLLASSEWLRVVVKRPAAELGQLTVAAGDYSVDELSHVVSFGRTIAGVYGAETIGIPHLAVAVVLTAEIPREQRLDCAQVVAEAFGLGTLEGMDQLHNQHVLRLEDPEVPESRYGIMLTRRGESEFKLARWLHLGVRLAAAVAVVVTGAGWTAWPLAVLALIPARDSREVPLHLGDEVCPGLRTRVPMPAIWGVPAAALGQYEAAAILLTAHGVLEFLSRAAEFLVAREHRLFDRRRHPMHSAFARLASLPERFLTRRHLRRMAVSYLLAVLPTILVFAPATRLWTLFAVAALLVARRTTGIAVVTLLVAAVLGEWLILVVAVPWVFGAGWTARWANRWLDRPPQAVTPVPWRNPMGQWIVHHRARRLLHLDRPNAAGQLLAGRQAPVLKALYAWALVQSGQLGPAKEAAAELSEDFADIRDLILLIVEVELANGEAAGGLADHLVGPGDRTEEARRFHQLLLLTFTRARMLANPSEDYLYASALLRHSDLKVGQAQVLDTATTLRVVADGMLRSNPDLAEAISAMAFMLLLREAEDRRVQFFGLVGSHRRLAVEFTRAAASLIRAQLRLPQPGFPDLDDLDPAAILLHLDRPMEAAALLNETAEALQLRPGGRAVALDKRLEALSVLQWTRHQLSDLVARRAWWDAASETLEKAMAQAALGQDWETLAELIEAARLQLGPQPDEVGGRDLAGAAVPFIRVRGTSRLEQAAWYRAGDRPKSYDLEDLTRYVAGEHSWWWSTWSIGERLYWALVPPSGPTYGGVLPEDTVGRAFADLRAALPIPHAGESLDALRLRVFTGPLAGPYSAELAMARRLGELIPPRLRDELLDRRALTRLAIAPAQMLANVPWALVAVAPDERLVELAQLAIAPPAAVLAAMSRRERSAQRLPLSLAVLNPAGRLAGSRDLTQADALIDLVTADTVTVTADDEITVADLGRTLRSLPYESTAVFACHTEKEDGVPLSSGLCLRPKVAGRYEISEVLTAGLLVEQPATYPVPRQVILFACESADLRQAELGEWLVLGPAMLWAGAERIVVTNYPVLDGSTIDARLIEGLTDDSDLSVSLRCAQLKELAGWRTLGSLDTWPLFWGAHVAMGAYGGGVLRSQPATDRFVHESLVKLIDSSARYAALSGRAEVTLRDVLQYFLNYGYEDDLPSVTRKVLIKAIGFITSLVHERAGRSRRRHGDRIVLSAEVEELLRRAVAFADGARQNVVDVEHMLCAALSARGRWPSMARMLSGWDSRHPEVSKELLGEPGRYVSVGLPTTDRLAASSVTAIYAIAGASLPLEPSDLILRTDLVNHSTAARKGQQ